MPKAFNEKEKIIIKEKLLDIGYDLFSKFGIKKTSIKDLTTKAGIAQGSFYLFFNSKEELFFELLEREENKIKNELISEEMRNGQLDKKDFIDFLKKSFELIAENDLFKSIYNNEQYTMLLNNLSEDKINNHIENDEKVLKPVIKMLQNNNKIINIEPKIIIGLLRALFTISIHEKEIGEEYKRVIDLFIYCISEGLYKKERDIND